jgi:HK97 family phage portal protein
MSISNNLKKIKNIFSKKEAIPTNYYQSFIHNIGEPIWMKREYSKFAEDGYVKNVIANRAINMIAQLATSVPWRLYNMQNGEQVQIKAHPLLDLLHRPNPSYGGAEFFENIYAYKMISGNAYILAVYANNAYPRELHILRPDRVTVVPGKNGLPQGYIYKLEQTEKYYPVNNLTGKSDILHIRNFHPLNDWYGLSNIEPATYSIEQHNQAAIWNQALLQNGARPSGAMIVKATAENGGTGTLTEEQYIRLREQIDKRFSGSVNAGKPLLLEGGLDWKEMSLSPRDMDFIESKNSAARDIALAFGVPPQLLGIPGDNTYSNLQEARLALWEETILPLLDHMADALNNWLVPIFGSNLKVYYDKDEISALAPRNEKIWARIEGASFMTQNEKRAAVGLSPIDGNDIINS